LGAVLAEGAAGVHPANPTSTSVKTEARKGVVLRKDKKDEVMIVSLWCLVRLGGIHRPVSTSGVIARFGGRRPIVTDAERCAGAPAANL
jgi:hypothetical protein